MTSGIIKLVGYGDFAPVTLGGRFSESWAAILGAFVLTTMVVALATELKMTKDQI